MMKREFDREILQDLSWSNVGDEFDGYELISNERTGSGRWLEYYTMIFKFEDKLWSSDYSVGLTEQQDQQAYEYDDPVAHEVEEITETVVVKKYVRVKGD